MLSESSEPQLPPHAPTFEDYEQQALANLRLMSRTSRGVSDTSSSPEKPGLATEGLELAEKTEANFRHALEFAWENRGVNLSDPYATWDLVIGVAERVSEGLLRPGQSIWRTWKTNYESTHPEHIIEETQGFCERIGEQAELMGPMALAALIEQQIDGKIHPFADGCGRSAKALSAMVLMRAGRSLPEYRGREEYYDHINLPFDDWREHYASYFDTEAA